MGMKTGAKLAAISLVALAGATAAQAQDTIPIQVTFTGTVASSAQDNIMVRQPDGSMGSYQGVTPNYSYQNNDPVSISFQTTVPSQAAFASNPGLLGADGTYRVPVNFASSGSGSYGSVNPGSFVVSGPIGLASTNQAAGLGGITLVYDSNTGEYSMDMPSGSWAFGLADGPSYEYDYATNSLTASDSACLNNCIYGDGGIRATGTQNSVSYRGTIVGTPETPGGNEYQAGFWDMIWNGSWNLPISGSSGGTSSGGATPVPEPSIVILFGSAAAGLMFARRRRKRV